MPQLILAIDQGTTGTTVFVVDARGRIRGRAYAEIRQFYPEPGWVEHDPEEIYRSVVTLAKKAISAAKVSPSAIAGIGITNQRETFVVWDRRSGRPVYRAIVWQCRRSAAICDALRDREPEVASRTGLLVDPYFSGTKLKWLLDLKPELRARAARGDLCFGTIDTWLVYKLSRGAAFVTDFTNASRTMMFNLASREWDDDMLAMLNVPREMLPCAVSSRGPLAETAPGTIVPHAIPIAAVIGDQQSALYGQGAVAAGDSKATYGTGAFLLMNTGDKIVPSKNRLLTTAALGPAGDPAYALEGSVFIAGAAVQWLRDGLKLVRKAADTYAEARASLAKNKDRTLALRRARVRRSRRAALGRERARRYRGDYSRHHSRRYRPRDARQYRLPGARRNSCDGIRHRSSDERAARRRRRDREPLPDAVPGGYSWQAGPPREDSRDHRDGCGDARRFGRRSMEVAGRDARADQRRRRVQAEDEND